MQNQKAVSAYFTSKKILPFGFAGQISSAGFSRVTGKMSSVKVRRDDRQKRDLVSVRDDTLNKAPL